MRKRILLIFCFGVIIVGLIISIEWGQIKTVFLQIEAKPVHHQVIHQSNGKNTKEEKAIKEALVFAKYLPNLKPKNYEFDIIVIKDWAFGDIVAKDESNNLVKLNEVVLRKINGGWKVAPVKNTIPIEQLEWENEMPKDIKDYFEKWNASHYD